VSEPAGYLDKLRKTEPEVVFENVQFKTELNWILNIVFGIICIGIVASGAADGSPTFKVALAYLGWLEFATAALNLLPVPGLDGYGIIEPYLPYGIRAVINPIANYAIILLLVLMISTGFGAFLFGIADSALEAMGVDPLFAEVGRFIGNVRLT